MYELGSFSNDTGQATENRVQNRKERAPQRSISPGPVRKLFSNPTASRIRLLALTTLLNVISEQLRYAGTNNVSADVNSEGI